MDTIEKAIEAGYQTHITSLYKALSQSILAANGNSDDIASAEFRFKKGLTFAADVKHRARAAANL